MTVFKYKIIKVSWWARWAVLPCKFRSPSHKFVPARQTPKTTKTARGAEVRALTSPGSRDRGPAGRGVAEKSEPLCFERIAGSRKITILDLVFFYTLFIFLYTFEKFYFFIHLSFYTLYFSLKNTLLPSAKVCLFFHEFI